MADIHGASGRRLRAARSLAAVALGLAVLGALVLGSASLGYRLGWWRLPTAFAILRACVYPAIAIALLALVGLVLSLAARSWTSLGVALVAIILAVGTAAIPLQIRRAGESVPRIHDITTDTDNPPQFVALRAVRERAPNGAGYEGPAVAAQQTRGYPDIGPLRLAVPPDRAFAQAESAARKLGWQIAAAVPGEGRLEATDTTRWFGFKDDIVVRVAAAPGGSRVDVRSVSRVGRSDLGVNARRIRAFQAAVSGS
jgi:uncharacterized protein (DUF1499 family)